MTLPINAAHKTRSTWRVAHADLLCMAPKQNSTPETHAEKRKRMRLAGITPGWIMPDDNAKHDPWEVRVQDVSRHGVGFECTERLKDGDIVRIRIGRGPIELAKRVRVVRCNPAQDGTFRVGGEFV